MTLSITKLQDFLKTNGFLIQKKFTIHDSIIYIEILNIKNADIFLLYIPSKYKIKTEDTNNTYKLKCIDIDDKNIFKDFSEKIESEDIDNQYNNLSLEINNIKHNEDLEKILKEGYDHELHLKDLNKDDTQNLKDIYYQLSRLTTCVKNIKYKLCIFYKNYLCSIRRDNSIECFIIKDFIKYENDRRIFIFVDLENLFQNILNISDNIKKVKQGIYKILNDNQIKNSIILNNILQQKNSIILCSDQVYKKKIELELYIKKLEELLLKVNESEKMVIEKIFKLNEDKNTDVQNDIKNSHLIYNYDKELEKITNVKKEIVKDILNSRIKQENITLEIDKILFDNSVMINIINKNFTKLLQIL